MLVLKMFLMAVAQILHILIFVYTLIIIAGAVFSFVNPDPYNKLVQIVYRLTEPVYSFIRRRIPTAYGGLDFAPMIVLLALVFIDEFFVNLVVAYASRI